MRAGGNSMDLLLLEPFYYLSCGCLGNRQGKKCPQAGTYNIGIVQIGRAGTNHNRINPSRIGGAQDRAQVTRFLNSFDDHHKGRGTQRQYSQRAINIGNHQ